MSWITRKLGALFGIALTVPTVVHTAQVTGPGVAMTKRRDHDSPVDGPEPPHQEIVHEAAVTPPPPVMPFVNNTSMGQQQDAEREAHEIAVRTSMDQSRNNALLMLYRAGAAQQAATSSDPDLPPPPS